MRLLCLNVLAMASIGMAIQPALAEGLDVKPVTPAVSATAKQASPSFSDAEVHDFLEKAHRAETISDPLKRCIAYPDPPGSHWSAEATRAYCVYHMQTFVSYEDAKAWVESGKAAKLDAYLSDAAKKQLTRKESAGLLDHIYFGHFSDASPETRAMIDSWMRQRPKSAFALAASGRSYLAAAWQARGTDYASKTPRENFERMNAWLMFARRDLEQAIAIDPRVFPAYTAMINIGMAQGDDEYAGQAARKGLAVQPANYSIYGQLMGLAQPRWGGSLDEMSRITAEAQTHAKDNGLLMLLLPLRAAYEAKLTDCNCADPNAYRTILDQMPAGELLSGAAYAVDAADRKDLAVVYQSEVIRFYPWADLEKAKRVRHLIAFGERAWARMDADKLSTQPSSGRDILKILNNDYMTLGDFAAVKRTFLRMDELRAKEQ